MPLLLAVSFGIWVREGRLAVQGLAAFVLATVLLAAGGAIAALLAEPPLQFDQFGSLATGFLLSLIVGAAAAVSTADDVGRRELIGLAAASQLALLPAWFGISLVYGFDADPSERAIASGVNVLALLAASLIAYLCIRMRPRVTH